MHFFTEKGPETEMLTEESQETRWWYRQADPTTVGW